jgi:homoserine O-acetyltransferase
MSFVDSATQVPSPAPSSCPVQPASTCHAHATRGQVDVVLPLRHAGQRALRIAYECLGPAGAPVVLVAGGISAHRHVLASERYPDAGWWQAQAGHGLDAGATRLLAIDWLGADGSLDAPIDPADQADAIAAVLDALGIERIALFVGCSYGAMVGLQFAAAHAARIERLVAISGTHRAHPYASAWRALQRQAVALGQLQCDASQGLALARQLAMLAYRTPQEFDERFDAAPVIVHGRVRVAAEDYLDACGAQYVARTPETAFLRLSESIDLHAVLPDAIAVPTIVVTVLEDRLVPAEDAFALVERLPHGCLKVLRSKYGHDAFLKETQAIAEVLAAALATCRGGAA